MINFVDNNPRVKELKKQAKILLRQLKAKKSDITLRACHDLIAQQHGYKHWYEFHKEIKNLYQTKEVEIKEYFFKQTPLNYINYGYSKEIGLNYCLEKYTKLNHTLVTGIDRKKINLHLIEQTIKANEHMVFLDGEGQSIDEIIQIAMKAGREKDLRVISFLGGETMTIPKSLSNTSGNLTELFISLLNEETNEAEYAWRGRAISFISTLIMALVYMRDKEGFTFNFETIREYLIFDNVVNLYKRKLPIHIHNALHTYLLSLGFQESLQKQNDVVLEQHGYLQMQFAKILSILMDSYGYLFSESPTLQYSDLLGKNENMIILVKFPNLENYPENITIISNFFMGLMKSQLQFDVKYNRKMTWYINNCPIFKGFAVILPQAKINNISMVLSYPDTTFLKYNQDEYMSVKSNCSIKIKMTNDNLYELQYQEKSYILKI